jgi:hypothetical protein
MNERLGLSILKLTLLQILQNELNFIQLFNSEGIEINFQSQHFSPVGPIIKKFAKINFTAFPTELRNKISRIGEAYNDLSFGHLVGYFIC